MHTYVGSHYYVDREPFNEGLRRTGVQIYVFPASHSTN